MQWYNLASFKERVKVLNLLKVHPMIAKYDWKMLSTTLQNKIEGVVRNDR